MAQLVKIITMSNGIIIDHSTPRKFILTVSLSQHLTGIPIAKVIKADWNKAKARDVANLIENVGFNLDPEDVPGTLKALKSKLEGRSWDGIILGWCIRGHVEFTTLFEKVVVTCFEVMRLTPHTKIMFCTGPDNLVETVLRNFPVEGSS